MNQPWYSKLQQYHRIFILGNITVISLSWVGSHILIYSPEGRTQQPASRHMDSTKIGFFVKLFFLLLMPTVFWQASILFSRPLRLAIRQCTTTVPHDHFICWDEEKWEGLNTGCTSQVWNWEDHIFSKNAEKSVYIRCFLWDRLAKMPLKKGDIRGKRLKRERTGLNIEWSRNLPLSDTPQILVS